MREDDTPKSRKGIDLGFSPEEKEKLRELAFQAIRCCCLGEEMPSISVDAPRLKAPGAAFVCIHKGKELRGCIGVLEARTPLWETIRRMAVEAAFGDPRFCALATDELDKIDIEISVLTPMKRISDPSEIQIGKHGLFIRKGYHSGLLLPQVATEQGWDRMQFLKWICCKAGIPENSWKDKDAELYIFSADVF